MYLLAHFKSSDWLPGRFADTRREPCSPTRQFYIPQQPAEGKAFGIHKCVLVIVLVNMMVHSAAKFTHPVLRSRILKKISSYWLRFPSYLKKIMCCFHIFTPDSAPTGSSSATLLVPVVL